MLHISEKYKPLFDLPKAQDAIVSENFDKWPKEKQDYWTGLSEVMTVVITGGRGSGKSVMLETSSADNCDEYGHKIYYTRFTNESLEDTVIKDFEESLILAGIGTAKVLKKSISFPHNGGVITFRGLKRGSKAQTAGGKGISVYNVQVVEEAEEHPGLAEFEKMQLSLRNKDFQCYSILNLNPTTKEHWIFTEFFEDRGVPEGFNGIKDEVLYIHTTYLDVKKEFHTKQNWRIYQERKRCYDLYNETALEDRIKLDRRTIRLAEYYKYEILGGWKDKAEGVIFKNWKYGDFPKDLPFCHGLDFGFNPDPCGVVKVAVDKKRKKLYVEEKLYKTELLNADLIYNLEQFTNKKDLIVADCAEPKSIGELKAKGYNVVGCSKGPDSIRKGIKDMLDYELIVCGESKNYKRELNNYVWNDKRSGVPVVDNFNHLIDPTRYALERLTRGFYAG